MRNLYPIFLDVTGKRAVVIGGGKVAARKAASLVEAGAAVTVISPGLDPEMERLAREGAVTHEAKAYTRGDLAGASLAFAATDDPKVNLMAEKEAFEAGVPINCATPADSGSFVVPSSIRRGFLTVAISSGGGCPALSKRLRKDLEEFLGERYAPFLEFLDAARGELKKSLDDEDARREALTALVDSDLAAQFGKLEPGEAARLGNAMLAELVGRLKPTI